MSSIEFSRNLPISYHVDVFVAGGGPAGLAAAITAARQGASVLLIEGSACFGGMGTAAGLPMFCSPTDGVNPTSAGFGFEVYERLIAADGTPPEVRSKPIGSTLFAFNPEILKRVYDAMVAESGIHALLQTQLLDVQVSDGTVHHAICAAKSGLFAIRASLFIDATGDGDLCTRAGAPFEKGDEDGGMQPPTLMSLWGDIDWDRAQAAGCGVWTHEKELRRAIADGVLSVPDHHLPGMIPIGPHAAWGNVGHVFGIDGTNEVSITEGLMRGRAMLREYERYFKEYLTGFEAMQLLGTGALLGVRETRRILGDYVLCLEDFNRRAVFDDEIGRFSYPVDLHATRPDPEAFEQFEQAFQRLRYQPGESYGIPFRCLLPKTLNNVLVAGRCISTDRPIQGSVRAMPGCFITGQAAGVAAALAASLGRPTRSLDPLGLQERLAAMGAYLPNRRTATASAKGVNHE